jgi:twitching motility protein PilT
MVDYKKYLEELLLATAQSGASDLHLSPGNYPITRIDGRLVAMKDKKIFNQETLEGIVFSLLGEERKERFLFDKEMDFSHESEQGTRFRVNVYFTQGRPAATLRLIPVKIKTIEELNLPPVLKLFGKLSQGFVLIVGPNGHGKSTTMAAMIDLMNKERSAKIVTIEDPIEYIFTPDKSVIDQRELNLDTHSFHRALRSTFRQNTNVIMVGELRDYETMSAAVSAAETGHLVLASLHTNSASQTIERIIDLFPASQQPQIRGQLASTISGVISQRLIPRIKGGLIPAVEVMFANSAVRNIIRENRPRQLDMVIETNQDSGMISLNRSLAQLIKDKEITKENAEFYSLNVSELRAIMK